MEEYGNILIVPLVVGLVEVIKRAKFPERFAPLVSLAVGLVISAVVNEGLKEIFLYGLFYGLSASGLYSGGKALYYGE